MLTYEKAREIFSYNKETGQLLWKQPGPKRNVGQPVGHTSKDGYTRVMVAGKLYLVHRIIWLICTGAWPKNILDHIDRNQRNNKFENLRDVGYAANGHNSKVRADNQTGHRGVSLNTVTGTYNVNVRVANVATLEEAVALAEKVYVFINR